MDSHRPTDTAFDPSSTDALLDRCRRIATSTWSDALDQLGIRGVTEGITPRTGSGRIAGRAVTIHEEIRPLGGYPVEEFAVGRLLQAATTGEVLVIDMGGAAVSTLGGLAAQAAVARGIAGVLIDGGCRDIEEIRPTALWVASRHVTPVSGKQRARVASINATVRLGGVNVSCGDYLVADLTGIVVVPAAQVQQALALAEHLERQDERFRRALDNGEDFAAIAAALRHL
ncbi:MAG: RraA family protein [Thermomicrobia bacterium]|nr:RraA family protein [Thermomicrobia bacterium]MCA1726055.1 RraA family protein [Thermomicrobia bacterium]